MAVREEETLNSSTCKSLSLYLDEEEGEEEEREYLASPMSGKDRECQLLLKLRMRSHAQPIRAFSNPLLLL